MKRGVAGHATGLVVTRLHRFDLVGSAAPPSPGLTRADCIAYGDALSDAELLGWVPTSIAVNADQRLAALAMHPYTGQDLWNAYELVFHAR